MEVRKKNILGRGTGSAKALCWDEFDVVMGLQGQWGLV